MKFIYLKAMNSIVLVLLTGISTGEGFVARQKYSYQEDALSRIDSDQGCPPGEHHDCFEPGHVTNRTDCRNHGCFWCPKYGRPGPWCVTGAECSVFPREDCFPTGSRVNRTLCRSKGCFWCRGDPDEPWCVTGAKRVLMSDMMPQGNPICPDGQIIRYEQNGTCCKVTEDLRCGHVPSQGRIVGGSISSRGVWPWMIYFEPFFGATCGATLISPKLALTAGHCVSHFSIIDMSVKLGIIDLDYPKKDLMITRKIRRYAVHPSYTFEPSVSSDVAILEFTEAVGYSHYIQPICLPQSEKPPVGSKCFIAGWGAETYVGDVSKQLREVGIRILQDDDCGNYGSMYMPSHMICAGYVDGSADSCLGDSGGPLMCQRCSSCQWYLAGIVSFGMDCGLPGFPGVYTKVAGFEQWLEGEGVPTNEEKFSC